MVTSKVTLMPKKPATAKAPKIIPPSGWSADAKLGLLYAHDAQGQIVDLVRLSDLVTWLVEEKTVRRRSEALHEIAKKLPSNAMEWLFELQIDDPARFIPPTEMFGEWSKEKLDEEKAKLKKENRSKTRPFLGGTLLIKANARPSNSLDGIQPVEPGLPALRRYIGLFVRALDRGGLKDNPLNSKREFIARIAIPQAKAHELFGWGTQEGCIAAVNDKSPSSYPELLLYRQKNPGHAWTLELRSILREEEDRRKREVPNYVRKQIAEELGMSKQAVGQHILKTDSKSGRGRSGQSNKSNGACRFK